MTQMKRVMSLDMASGFGILIIVFAYVVQFHSSLEQLNLYFYSFHVSVFYAFLLVCMSILFVMLFRNTPKKMY